MNGGALPQFAFQTDGDAVLFGNPCCYGEPQPCAADAALRLGTGAVHAIEAVKDLFLILRSNTDTIIGKSYFHKRTFRAVSTPGSYSNPTACRCVFAAIIQKNPKQLPHRYQIAVHHPIIILQKFHGMLPDNQLHFLDNISQKFTQLNIFLVQHLPILVGTGQKQQFFNQLLHIFCL